MKGDRLSSFCYQATREHFAIETTTSTLRKLVKYPFYLVAKWIGKDYFQNKLGRLAGAKDYETSKYIGCVIWLRVARKIFFWKSGSMKLLICHLENMNFVFQRLMTRCYDIHMGIICSCLRKKIESAIIIIKCMKNKMKYSGFLCENQNIFLTMCS